MIDFLQSFGQSIKLKNTRWDKTKIFEDKQVYSDNTFWAKNYFVQCDVDFISISSLKFGLEECEDFQSRLLGDDFFSEQTMLRWNYYLYFVLEDNSLLENIDKDKIESDTHYARKRIVPLEKLDELLEPICYGNQNKEMPDPEGEWLDILKQEHLEGCLNNDQYDASVRNYIENDVLIGNLIDHLKKHISQENKHNLIPTRIKTLDMENYRPVVFGKKKSIEFGAVNLIEGENGAGKSSIIDAIELALTGSIKRYKETTRNLEDEKTLVKAFTKTNKIEIFTSNGNPDIKEREQAWYNVPKTRMSTTIGEKFDQINRFSIESVFSLVNSQCREQNGSIQDSISKLCFGESLFLMQKNWTTYLDRFNREHRTHADQLKRLEKDQNDIENNIKSLEIKIKDRQVDIIPLYSYFFGKSPETKNSITILEDLYLRFEKEISLFSFISESIDYDSFKSSHLQQKNCTIQLQKQMNTYEINEKESTLKKHSLATCEKRQKEAGEALTFYTIIMKEANDLIQEMRLNDVLENKLESIFSENKKKISAFNNLLNEYQDYFELNSEQPLLSQIQIELQSCEIQKNINELNLIIPDYMEQNKKLNDEKDIIGQNLNHIQKLQTELMQHGQDIIDATKRNDCPLCGHIYKSANELLLTIRNLNQQNSLPDQSRLDSVTKKLKEVQSQIKTAQQTKKKLEKEKCSIESMYQILQICKNLMDFQHDGNVGTLQISIKKQVNQISDKTTRLEKIQEKIDILQNKFMSKGLQKSTVEEYMAISQKKIKSFTEELENLQNEKGSISLIISKIETELLKNKDTKDLLQKSEQKEKKMASIKAAIENLHSVGVKIMPETDLFLLKNNLLKLEGVIKVISENNEMNILMNNKNQKMEDIAKTKRYLERCNVALKPLRKLNNLNYYSETFLKFNLKKISALFRKLHLPPEFTKVDIVGKEIVIRRMNSKDYIHINQMSMGQRISLTLAILFQMHIMSENTPRILLLDEPVSNLDDVHIMNMVDILRELLLNGAQLFITTANNEIANYFKRKFAFLDNDLVCYQLKRDISKGEVGEVIIKKQPLYYVIDSGEYMQAELK